MKKERQLGVIGAGILIGLAALALTALGNPYLLCKLSSE